MIVFRLDNKAIESSIPDNEDCFEIEEEIEIQPTKSLLSGPALLAPGTNTVTVKAKVCVYFVNSYFYNASFEFKFYPGTFILPHNVSHSIRSTHCKGTCTKKP